MQAALLFLLFSFLIILGILISMLYVVRQQSVAIVERFGRYQKIATSGIHMRLPFGIDKIAARIQLRLLQSEIVVETKTKDNVAPRPNRFPISLKIPLVEICPRTVPASVRIMADVKMEAVQALMVSKAASFLGYSSRNSIYRLVNSIA